MGFIIPCARRVIECFNALSLEVHDNPYLHLFYYLNYLLKYYEFIDTYIIILKKKNVIFLHWYHHASESWRKRFP